MMQTNTLNKSKNSNNQDNLGLSLQKDLQECQALDRISQLSEWKNYLKPVLQAQLNNKWLDPAEFSDNETFIKAYNEVYARARAFQEVILKIDGASNRISDIKTRMESLTKNYAV